MQEEDWLGLLINLSEIAVEYWNFYFMVILGVLGYLFQRSKPLTRTSKFILAFVFISFALGNLGAQIHIQTLMENITFKLDCQKSVEMGFIQVRKCLDTIWLMPKWIVVLIHLPADFVISFYILKSGKSSEKALNNHLQN